MFRNFIYASVLAFFLVGCSFNQLENDGFEREKVSKEFTDDVGYILYLLKTNDIETLNKFYINPQYGVYTVYMTDFDNVMTFKKEDRIDEINNIVDNFDIQEGIVTFNCSPTNDAYYGWDKDGTFITSNTKPYLSHLMSDKTKYKEDELKRVEIIEKTSREVIVTNNIIFYLTNIDGKRYITLIDYVTTDCSK